MLECIKNKRTLAVIGLIFLGIIGLGHLTGSLDSIFSFAGKYILKRAAALDQKGYKKTELIASATASLKLHINPTEIEEPEPGKPWYGWIDIFEGNKQFRAFLRAKIPPTLWGRDGKINDIWLEFSMVDESPLIGKPFSSMDKLKGLEICLSFLRKSIEVTGGECIIILNGKERKEYSIPSQKSQIFCIDVDLRKR